ncbi:hypothetical protein Pmar_PMAR021980 [Perkinsus marinus ATCC 50983]|uniref:Uncharacterized protein n=1 Tax=Perkinsus marinus (strain ATCC 50983 / TXsc) TaxID=423536 RepID=C5LRP9_PERM5|nr:hypothetical protein Pmar_PMAR021980 [Perkinsus marinus ATCC 50983]EER00608.1 hypothetical protein Pmar_PMAR021980 [Perkinsus marinus ATCC 50983]|eukprot:XP_002767890.1 hypothetical protein Pmar_PMAR021980 [Perkinsus marinus ATCC 50983]
MPAENANAAAPRVVYVKEPPDSTCCCGCTFTFALQVFAAMDLVFGLIGLVTTALQGIQASQVSSYADYYGGPIHAVLMMDSTNDAAYTIQAANSGLTASTVIMAGLGLLGVYQQNPLYVRIYAYSCVVRVLVLGLLTLTSLLWMNTILSTQVDVLVSFIEQLPLFEYFKEADIPFSINGSTIASLFGYICGFLLVLSLVCELCFRCFVAWIGLRCAACIEAPAPVEAPAQPRDQGGDNVTLTIPTTGQPGEPIRLVVDGQSITLAAPTADSSPSDNGGLRRR